VLTGGGLSRALGGVGIGRVRLPAYPFGYSPLSTLRVPLRLLSEYPFEYSSSTPSSTPLQAAGFRTFGVGVGRVRVRLLAALERARLAPKHVPWCADRLFPYSDGSFPLNFGRFPLTAHSRLITADSRFPLQTDSQLLMVST
jgi:hypothetical protein